MKMHTPIDGYCERLSEAYWAEPLNALTNIAFLLAAFVAWRRGRAKAGFCGLGPWMVVLVAVIGFGSFLFHTFATTWAALADVIPIAVYIYVFFGLAMVRFLGFSKKTAIGLSLAYFAASIPSVQLVGRLPFVGSSAGYVPALLALFGVAGLLVWRRHPAGLSLVAAGGVFLVSLTFRTVDEPLCNAFPVGFHFIWHCLNAVVLYITLHALLSTAPKGSSRIARQKDVSRSNQT